MQSVVKPVIIRLQQYNNIRSVKYDNVKLKEEKKNKMIRERKQEDMKFKV